MQLAFSLHSALLCQLFKVLHPWRDQRDWGPEEKSTPEWKHIDCWYICGNMQTTFFGDQDQERAHWQFHNQWLQSAFIHYCAKLQTANIVEKRWTSIERGGKHIRNWKWQNLHSDQVMDWTVIAWQTKSSVHSIIHRKHGPIFQHELHINYFYWPQAIT